MAGVRLRGVVKKYGDNEVVHGLDLDIEDQEFLVLVGPSGCGKSTILRMIAGLEDITSGEITIGDRVVNELEPKDRNIAMVFQDYALYPHLTVYKNISFGLEMQKLPREQIEERVAAAAEILNIKELLDRKPKQLSGGQRQRVAMGRSIVRRPNVFLFDEPLSNLDAKLRTQMRTEIKKLHHRLATTVIYVTHDQVEAMTLADRMVVMRDGHVEQIGSPSEVYNHPASVFVAGFIGAPTMNFIPGRLARDNGGLYLTIGSTTVLRIADRHAERYAAHADRDVVLGLRPEGLALSAAESVREAVDVLRTQVNVVEPLGATTLVFSQMAGVEIVAALPWDPALKPGDAIFLTADMTKAHLFDPRTKRTL